MTNHNSGRADSDDDDRPQPNPAGWRCWVRRRRPSLLRQGEPWREVGETHGSYRDAWSRLLLYYGGSRGIDRLVLRDGEDPNRDA